MPDYTDDWMNPKPAVFEHKPPENKTVYRILRKKFVPTFGTGRVHEWRVWDTFDTAKARDEELKRLHKEYPMWQLKTAEANPYYESIGIFLDDD